MPVLPMTLMRKKSGGLPAQTFSGAPELVVEDILSHHNCDASPVAPTLAWGIIPLSGSVACGEGRRAFAPNAAAHFWPLLESDHGAQTGKGRGVSDHLPSRMFVWSPYLKTNEHDFPGIDKLFIAAERYRLGRDGGRCGFIFVPQSRTKAFSSLPLRKHVPIPDELTNMHAALHLASDSGRSRISSSVRRRCAKGGSGGISLFPGHARLRLQDVIDPETDGRILA
jgi:hypothetical protein